MPRSAGATMLTPKEFARWTGVLLSLASIVFAVLSYTGFWSHIRSDDLLTGVADRFSLSYGPDAAKEVRSDDPEWEPLMRVVKRYTRAKLPPDREPKVLARSVAVASQKLVAGDNIVAEWTAPTTPIIIFYRSWPDPGSGPFIKGKDFWTVGTVGDLHDWIRRDQADFDFLWRTLILGALSLCVAIFLALPDKRRPDRGSG